MSDPVRKDRVCIISVWSSRVTGVWTAVINQLRHPAIAAAAAAVSRDDEDAGGVIKVRHVR